MPYLPGREVGCSRMPLVLENAISAEVMSAEILLSVQTLSRLFGLAICFWGEDLKDKVQEYQRSWTANILECKHFEL